MMTGISQGFLDHSSLYKSPKSEVNNATANAAMVKFAKTEIFFLAE
jgi:hypothetical protein